MTGSFDDRLERRPRLRHLEAGGEELLGARRERPRVGVGDEHVGRFAARRPASPSRRALAAKTGFCGDVRRCTPQKEQETCPRERFSCEQRPRTGASRDSPESAPIQPRSQRSRPTPASAPPTSKMPSNAICPWGSMRDITSSAREAHRRARQARSRTLCARGCAGNDDSRSDAPCSVDRWPCRAEVCGTIAQVCIAEKRRPQMSTSEVVTRSARPDTLLAEISEGDVVAVVWNFETLPDQGEAFERFYGADGEWTKLSRRSRSFLGSSFLKDHRASRALRAGRVLERDARLRKAPRGFRRRVAPAGGAAAALRRRMEAIGVFTALDVPDRVGPTWSRRSG